jgi:hypothetical protein
VLRAIRLKYLFELYDSRLRIAVAQEVGMSAARALVEAARASGARGQAAEGAGVGKASI